METLDPLKTIYLGDRGCMSILIDGWNSEVKLKVTCISRVRTATWDYYTDEDLPNGSIVFEGVTRVEFEPSGFVPNDTINGISAEPMLDQASKFLIVLSIDSVDLVGNRTEVTVRIQADAVAIEDAGEPPVRIRS